MTFGTIGIIGAMQEEIELLLEQMDNKQTEIHAGISYHRGVFRGKKVVLTRSGVGKVNAAVCTQILIDKFGADAVLFTGVAGAVDPDLNIGDIVISSSSLQHDIDVTALGFPRGTIPYQDISEYKADEKLVALAEEAGRALYPGRCKVGKILSGDQFIADREVVKTLHEQFEGACTEMEGASVAQVCFMNGIPHVIIRSMSDKADGSAHVNFAEFTVEASNRSYAIVEKMVASL
ncbi:5'-methylthioadenosine/S-adenosylhomocysteine nucleosidase [Cohnella sp. CIP 111063]|jgi:5''-methylthioadenosine/S-adenosylhomocysteine nucleosidase|uniref:5'-methylthioadenosine/adenosylhomocysteine nucleosidase n=1 Tax=unclassified Cohnella TaxID=2636738 RepID=UPI000B8C3E66|nr:MULTISPECIES: 5'-methylthioadenosine/adenosylhomocysteine nucleosidase [unclassified Cohnella]OXS62360.1 5'-methylthioadenosine/S-adenosylhomocysteine nucleosidase [Cohnella sp. CIP 111063]PRX74591.1 adenosylhomocysteine nucleosidase [Cohnella sp. SGD-V74]